MGTTNKTQLLNRARSIRGHMGAIVRMLEEDAYCVDIIKQSQAIEKAIDKLNITELMDVFQTANR